MNATDHFSGRTLLATLLVVLVGGTSSLAGDGAHLDEPTVEFRPAADQQLEMVVTVPFRGGCCFSLTTRNVAATLETPKEVAIVSGPEPPKYDRIVGLPGGTKATPAVFRWRLKTGKPGTPPVRPMKVKVTTGNSGEVIRECLLGSLAPCAVSPAEVADPSPCGKEIPVKVDVVSNNDDQFVESVRLYYATGISDVEKVVRAKSKLLTVGSSVKTRVVDGSFVDLVRRYEPTIWRGAIPPQVRGRVVYWVVAVDSSAAETTSKPATLRVVDFERSRLVTKIVWWSLGLAALLSLAVAVIRPKRMPQWGPGLVVLGARAPLVLAPSGTATGTTGSGRPVLAAVWLTAMAVFLYDVLLSPHVGTLSSLLRGLSK